MDIIFPINIINFINLSIYLIYIYMSTELCCICHGGLIENIYTLPECT